MPIESFLPNGVRGSVATAASRSGVLGDRFLAMARKEPPLVVNLDNVQSKRRLMEKIQKLRGLHEVSINPRKKTRSLNANSYYWAAYIGPWTEWLREQWGDPAITTEQAHALLKLKVLGAKEKMIEETGEVIELIPTTHDMDKDDFAIYLDKAREWLASFAGIVVLDSELFWESKEKRTA